MPRKIAANNMPAGTTTIRLKMLARNNLFINSLLYSSAAKIVSPSVGFVFDKSSLICEFTSDPRLHFVAEAINDQDRARSHVFSNHYCLKYVRNDFVCSHSQRATY